MEGASMSGVADQSQRMLRPNIAAFLYYFAAKAALIWFVIFLGTVFIFGQFDSGSSLLFSFLLFIAATSFAYILRLFKYDKERYIFQLEYFVYKGGGVVSDVERELVVKNVTHVKFLRPFLENLFFQTGSIHIQSAGAMDTEIHLKHIDRPVEVYEEILGIMKQKEFKLTRENLVQEETPHVLAVFFEVFYHVFGVSAFFLLYLSPIVLESEVDMASFFQNHGVWIILACLVVLPLWIGYSILHFMDLKRRVYRLYEDAIEYTEGFLNKERVIIPIENLSDSDVHQTFISRFFGLYDVRLSCQGSGQEILFKNILNGEVIAKNIDRLISERKTLGAASVNAEMPSEDHLVEGAQPFNRKVSYDREYKTEYRMKPLRVWLPFVVVLPLSIFVFPITIIYLIRKIIEQNCNTFLVKEDGFAHHYKFLSSRVRDFSLEKITGITFRRGIWDRLLGSCNVVFWSVGAGQSIVFKHVPYDEQMRDRILVKKGMREEEILHKVDSAFNIADFVMANCVLIGLLIVPVWIAVLALAGEGLMFTSLSVALLVLVTYKITYYRKEGMTCYRDYVHFHRGLFRLENVYVLYDDVKDITTVRYPLRNTGNLQFNVAGEMVSPLYAAQFEKNPKMAVSTRMMKSNQFVIHYVNNIPVLDEMIDTIFYRRPEAQEIARMMQNPVDTSSNALHVSKPALANPLCKHLFWLVPVDALAVFLIYLSPVEVILNSAAVLLFVNIFIFGLIIVQVLVISNCIQDYRVLKRSGVFFKKQTSVTFNKIDFINMDQKLLNKIFRNGNVSINTIGSSKVELFIENIPDFRQFYAKLKEKYQGR